MILLTRRLQQADHIHATLSLPRELRSRFRARVQLDDGRAAGLNLQRSHLLKDGDLIASESGLVVRVLAACEPVSVVICDDALILARAAYHLGNRHVALQIERGYLRYPHDAILDDMMRQMGLSVALLNVPFEPESGAYATHGGH